MNADDIDNDIITGHIPNQFGLVNPSSTTCFANSIFQSLFSMKRLVSTVCGLGFESLFKLSLPNSLQILKNFSDLILSNYKNKPENSEKLVRLLMLKIQQRSNQFPANQQHDSHEFLLSLLQWLLEELKILHDLTQSRTFLQIPGEIALTPPRNEAKCGIEFIEQNLFTEITQMVQCNICNNKSVRTNMEILSVSIENARDVNECLANHFSKTFMSKESGNAYKCDHCNKLVSATVTYKISKLPRILIINLKIFDSNVSNSNYGLHILIH